MVTESLPLLTAAQVAALEAHLMTDNDSAMTAIMGRAGHQLALLAARLLDEEVLDRPVVVLAGGGYHGGGGLVAARYLVEWGAWVQLLLAAPVAAYPAAVAEQLDILRTLDVGIAWAEEGWELPPTDLVIDALLGPDLRSAPTGKVRDLIYLANSSLAPILSLDLPSGLDPSRGQLYTPHIQARATMALGLPSVGIPAAAAQGAVGELYVADVGIPPELYAQVGLVVPPLFTTDPLLRLTVVGAQVIIAAA